MQKSWFAGCTIKKKQGQKLRWGEPHSEYWGNGPPIGRPALAEVEKPRLSSGASRAFNEPRLLVS